MAEKELQLELDNLKVEMEKLRADFAGVTAALKGAGKAEAESVKAGVAEITARAKEELRTLMDTVREKGKKSVEVVEDKVTEHPVISLLAAFGVGFVVAKLLDRK